MQGGDAVYITGIRFRTQGANKVVGWKLAAGVGKMRPVVTVAASVQQLETIAHALNFAFSGKRGGGVAEVWLDAADDAGDVWTIERGTKGSVFRRNNRLLSIEEAQRSLLASLLDLDASLNQSEGLVAPVEMRRMITRGADVAATQWNPQVAKERTEVAGFIAARERAEQCAKALGIAEFADAKKLSRVAGPSARLLGAVEELSQQREDLSVETGAGEKDPGLETIQSELDLLNQIDQVLRRINEGGDSFTKLSILLDAQNERLKAISSRWSEQTLTNMQRLSDPFQVLEQLIRLKAWGKFSENLSRLFGLIDEQVRPAHASGVKVWDEYLSGARTNGQEIESCLASMLLGIKQMSHEIDRYVSQGPAVSPSSHGASKSKQSGWFDRLKSGATRVVDDMSKESSAGIHYQRDWVMRLSREVESVKVATEYALQSSQNLTDKVGNARATVQDELKIIAALAQKATGEFERLRADWMRVTTELGIDPGVSLETLAGLIRDAMEHAVVMDTRHDLAVRVDDRRSVQNALESLIRQWWDVIGSQKTTDLSNVSFLVVEAKAALRYRDGRRQRVQKGLEEIARGMARRETAAYSARRLEILEREWGKLFSLAELPAPSLDLSKARIVADAANQCAALLDIARLEENERFAVASLWPSRLDSAVIIYYWPDEAVAPPQRSSFIRALGSFAGDGSVPVLLLINDKELAQMLTKAGTGSGIEMTLEGAAEVDGPRREGAIVKSELRSRRPAATKTQETPGHAGGASKPVEPSKTSLLSARAQAALRVLNPKSGK
jgi:hypothetical protein